MKYENNEEELKISNPKQRKKDSRKESKRKENKNYDRDNRIVSLNVKNKEFCKDDSDNVSHRSDKNQDYSGFEISQNTLNRNLKSRNSSKNIYSNTQYSSRSNKTNNFYGRHHYKGHKTRVRKVINSDNTQLYCNERSSTNIPTLDVVNMDLENATKFKNIKELHKVDEQDISSSDYYIKNYDDYDSSDFDFNEILSDLSSNYSATGEKKEMLRLSEDAILYEMDQMIKYPFVADWVEFFQLQAELQLYVNDYRKAAMNALAAENLKGEETERTLAVKMISSYQLNYKETSAATRDKLMKMNSRKTVLSVPLLKKFEGTSEVIDFVPQLLNFLNNEVRNRTINDSYMQEDNHFNELDYFFYNEAE